MSNVSYLLFLVAVVALLRFTDAVQKSTAEHDNEETTYVTPDGHIHPPKCWSSRDSAEERPRESTTPLLKTFTQ